MKKITFTFVVNDEVAGDVRDAFVYGDLGNAENTLNENCFKSDCEIEDVMA